MFKSLALFIGFRYLRAQRRNHFISFISLFSIIGIALGVMVLIVILSVMNGFESEVKKRLLNMEAHVTLRDFSAGWLQTINKVKKYPGVINAAPVLDGFGLINYGGESNGVAIRGINPNPEYDILGMEKHLIYGKLSNLNNNENGIILGYGIAKKLLGPEMLRRIEKKQMRPNSKVLLVVPQKNAQQLNILPNYKYFKVVGIFKLDMEIYDTNLVLLHLNSVAKLLGEPNAVSAIHVKLKDAFLVEQIKTAVQADGLAFRVSSWYEGQSNLFSAITNQKRLMALILFMLVVVAAINIISTLVMVVSDKSADIAILRTLGASPSTIKKIFITQGTLIGVVGTVVGVILGVLIAANVENIINALEKMLDTQLMSENVYFVTKLSAQIHVLEVGIIALGTFLITVLATLYPAHKAAKTEPAQELRYE